MHLYILATGFWAWWTKTWRQGWLPGASRLAVWLQAVGGDAGGAAELWQPAQPRQISDLWKIMCLIST